MPNKPKPPRQARRVTKSIRLNPEEADELGRLVEGTAYMEPTPQPLTSRGSSIWRINPASTIAQYSSRMASAKAKKKASSEG